MSPISIAYNSALLLTTVEPELSMKNQAARGADTLISFAP